MLKYLVFRNSGLVLKLKKRKLIMVYHLKMNKTHPEENIEEK